DAAIQDIADVQLPADFLGILLCSFEAYHRSARGYFKALDVRQLGYDLLGHAVAEILIFWIATQILKGEHRHRGLNSSGGGWGRDALPPPNTDSDNSSH